MNNIDFIIIAQSEVTDCDHYASLPLERIELFSHLIYPRMVHYKGQFLSHLDLLNYLSGGRRFDQAECSDRRELLNIWNLSSFSGIHLANYLLQFYIYTMVINNIDAEWDRFCDAYSQDDARPLVGISSTFMLSYNPVKRLVKRLREIDSRMQIVMGGHSQTSSSAPNRQH